MFLQAEQAATLAVRLKHVRLGGRFGETLVVKASKWLRDVANATRRHQADLKAGREMSESDHSCTARLIIIPVLNVYRFSNKKKDGNTVARTGSWTGSSWPVQSQVCRTVLFITVGSEMRFTPQSRTLSVASKLCRLLISQVLAHWQFLECSRVEIKPEFFMLLGETVVPTLVVLSTNFSCLFQRSS